MVDVEVVAVRHFVRQFRPAFVAGMLSGGVTAPASVVNPAAVLRQVFDGVTT